jgi:hypothetical protein
MSGFASLKKSGTGSFAALAEKMKESEKKGGSGSKDDRFWEPSVDKAGNGYAIIRFLPTPDGESMPYVKRYSHGFKEGAKWFIENCPTTIGGECPLCAKNSELWNTEIKSNQEIVRKRKRQLSYYANIYVVKDEKNPDAEGKVHLYRFGKKIFDKIMEAMNPQFEDDVALNPFDLWEGANFKLKIRQVEGYRNFDKSEFESKKALSSDDSKLEAIWNSQHKLEELIAEKQFKSEAELTLALNRVLAGATDKKSEEVAADELAEAYSDAKETPRKAASKKDEEDIDSDLAAYADLLGD